MSDQPKNPQDLWDRIRKSSKDSVILEEMIRHGFWPSTSQQPGEPVDEISRHAALSRRLGELSDEQRKLGNEAALRKAARDKRMAESRLRREETRQRKLEQRAAAAAAWKDRASREILYLGEGVSAGLGRREPDRAKLAAQGLPVFADAVELAAAIGISLGELRFLAFSREVSRVSHYRQFKLAKKTGGERLISAPMPRLKRVQRWILESVLARGAVESAAHGFVPGRSIVSNAVPHVGAGIVINLDLEEFFPTLTYRRVKGLFVKLGYAEEVATILALLCTEPRTVEVALDGQTWHVARTPRFLPQGAPTSPMVTNLICRRLDRRLGGLARSLGWTYTRYADDLTFSGPSAVGATVGGLIASTRRVIEAEGFRVHPRKTRVLRRGGRQEVTGLVVNDQLGVPRDQLRKFRALLHHIEKDGPAGKTWGAGGDVIASARGFASYVAMVDPTRGAALRARVERLATTPRPAR